MWREGTIIINKKGYRYWVKHFDEGSQFGIDGGRISKATLKISGEVVYNYDRGLDVPPRNEAAEMALAILMHEYN